MKPGLSPTLLGSSLAISFFASPSVHFFSPLKKLLVDWQKGFKYYTVMESLFEGEIKQKDLEIKEDRNSFKMSLLHILGFVYEIVLTS